MYRMGFTSRSDKTSFQISVSRCTDSMVAATYMQAGSKIPDASTAGLHLYMNYDLSSFSISSFQRAEVE